jgi:hypothetical protein
MIWSFIERSTFRLASVRQEAAKRGIIESTTHRFRVKRIDQAVSFFVIGIGYVLLFVPIWLENFYRDTKSRIGIVMAFTLLFAVFSVSATTSLTRGFETLAATAA